MTDTYFVTCDNGENIYLNGAACFMPLKRLDNHCGFIKGLGKDYLKSHKVVSLTYMVSIDDCDSAVIEKNKEIEDHDYKGMHNIPAKLRLEEMRQAHAFRELVKEAEKVKKK